MALSSEELALYPEEYLIEDEEEMSEKALHSLLIKYLILILERLYHIEKWFVVGNLGVTHPSINNSQHIITPDIGLFLGRIVTEAELDLISTWSIPQRGAPSVVFEIASASTWQMDIQGGPHQKPAVYGRIGIQEYWTYDPHTPQVWNGVNGQRLLGWRYNDMRQPESIQPDERGWFWSELMQSWLVPEGKNLRLHEPEGKMRLTGEETERQARLQAEAAERQAEAAVQAAQQHIAALEEELRRLKGGH